MASLPFPATMLDGMGIKDCVRVCWANEDAERNVEMKSEMIRCLMISPGRTATQQGSQPASEGQPNNGLTEGYATIVRRHDTMREHVEAFLYQAFFGEVEKKNILKHATSECDYRTSRFISDPRTNIHDAICDGVMEPGSNFIRRTAAPKISHYSIDQARRIKNCRVVTNQFDTVRVTAN